MVKTLCDLLTNAEKAKFLRYDKKRDETNSKSIGF